jgi:histidyl-tRNA synthetase
VTPLQPVRGTRDLIGEEQRRHQHVIDTARRVAATYGFDEWATPVFEDTSVFARTLGETSDVVTKEMYSFTTAAVNRSRCARRAPPACAGRWSATA